MRLPPYFLDGGGVCGELARSIDWSATPLGPPDSWPASLKTTVGILLHSRHPMFLWWGEDLIQFYNDAYMPSFGQGRHPAAMGQRGRDCWREVWPIIGPQIDDVMLHGKATWNEDHLVAIARNGRIEEVYWTYGYSPVYGDAGNVAGTLVVCTETTARVVAERRLELLRSLAIALLAARDVTTLTTNAAAVIAKAKLDVPFAIFGGPGGTAVGIDAVTADRVVTALHGRGERGFYALSSPLPAGPWPEPVTHAYAAALDGTVFGVSSRLTFDDAYRTFLEQVVEQIVSARARVRIDNERRSLLEQAPVATALMIGPNHVFEIANPLCRAMVGRDPRGLPFLDAFPELRGTALPGILDRAFRLGEPFVTSEMQVPLDRRGAGATEDFFFKFNLEPIRDSDGCVYGMMAIAVDLTRQVATRRALEAADRAKDEFLATMSHELRTPLNAMLGWARMLRGQRDDAAKLERGLAVIERNARTQARLVDDLLDVSRIVSGKLRLSMKRIDLSASLRAAVEVLRPAAEAKCVGVSVVVAPDFGATIADPDRVQQIIWNLVSNAIRFTPAGGTVTVSASRDSSFICIDVEDTGAGIAAEHIPYLFERFRQIDASITRAHGGLGLGLAIVRYLADAHGGGVTVRSDGPGRGTRFTVTLPVRSDESPDAPPPSAAADGERISEVPVMQTLHNVRVLVVDDDVDSLELLRDVLESAGAFLTTATSGKQALEARGTFDIIISDIGMPQMDGYELLGHIRSQAGGGGVPAIALTAYARPEDAERARASGFQDYLTKPVEVDVLLERIKTLVTVTVAGRGGTA
jgi:signal transduction histidine kinase/ActR/RegA family two-component response regulator